MKLMLFCFLIVLMGCHGSKSCFDESAGQDLVGRWSSINTHLSTHQVEFKSDGTGLAHGEGFFAPLINTDRAHSFLWQLDMDNRLHITWTNPNNESAQTELLLNKSSCNRLHLSKEWSESMIVLQRK